MPKQSLRRKVADLLMSIWPFVPSFLREWFVWSSNQKFLVGAAAVIFNEQGDVLLFHHTYRGAQHAWGLPSGWLKHGESVAGGIEREIYEESRLIVCVERPVLVEKSQEHPRVDLVFLARIESGTFQPSVEVDEIAFFARNALPRLWKGQPEMIEMAWNEWKMRPFVERRTE